MNYIELKGDLFTAPADYYLAHCISSDFAMGAGIAVSFNKIYNMKARLQDNYDMGTPRCFWQEYTDLEMNGVALKMDRVFNLVTKHSVWETPTLESIKNALIDMKKQMVEEGLTKLAMPLIGAGLDRQNWEDVSAIIQEVFKDTDIDIRIYRFT